MRQIMSQDHVETTQIMMETGHNMGVKEVTIMMMIHPMMNHNGGMDIPIKAETINNIKNDTMETITMDIIKIGTID